MEVAQNPRWLALDKDERQRLLDKHRHTDTEFTDWWDLLEEELKADLASKGFAMVIVYFSGFCSQGDGACFTGHVDDWTLFAPWVGLSEDAGRLLGECGATLSVVSTGRYCHEYTMTIDSIFVPDNPYDNDEEQILQQACWDAVLRKGDILAEEEEHILGVLRARAKEFYRQLEAEYDNLTSDDNVIAYILDHVLDEEAKEAAPN